MKETLYTIPLMDAFMAEDECPFCNIRRKLEQDSLDFLLGSASSYMESDIRAKTNQYGFCSEHYRKMFKYGNSLGNALMLQSYMQELQKGLHKKLTGFTVSKPSLFHKGKKDSSASSGNSVAAFCAKHVSNCYICRRNDDTFERYIDTFFSMIRSDEEFYKLFKASKGFCLQHFGILTQAAPSKLNSRQTEDFYHDLFPIMEQSFKRLNEDISWFVDKFDYRNKDADWKNSRDAVQRCMQKVTTRYPADDDYHSK